ncbi:hypothetical protein BK126_19500 [Paenibacillus sp. FSL H7-0326]|uniref:hypothetical protein n=1 Tax=Paenibacillus sp. FSL H7-0326 TaxID=1921144 RepID=UPI00096F1989|nr:hypothetical protein [Paenibacillus sp. FSL H7-0326]OMC66213.1 hypothetical protein BK126_19500 [Paenibacillus sp. FSL H7-0326]
MLMEEEVLALLRFGLILVIGAILIVVIVLMVRYKKAGYGWILAHLILFSWGALGWIKLLETRATTSSVQNSLTIGWIGLIWAMSMICMTIGLLRLRPSLNEK